jgi:hypothetical protein
MLLPLLIMLLGSAICTRLRYGTFESCIITTSASLIPIFIEKIRAIRQGGRAREPTLASAADHLPIQLWWHENQVSVNTSPSLEVRRAAGEVFPARRQTVASPVVRHVLLLLLKIAAWILAAGLLSYGILFVYAKYIF